jgi:LPS-assembly lipoprotein
MRAALAILALALLLAGCGFKLRGIAAVPYETIHVPGATGGIALDLKRSIQAGTDARVVDDPKLADAVLQFLHETRLKEVVALTATGRVREFRLIYQVGFRVYDAKGAEFVAPTQLQLYREVTFNDEVILAKEAEEQLLFRDMQADMVQLIMRRLAGAQPPTPAAR